MNIFNFRDELIDDCAEYFASFMNVRNKCIRDHSDEKLKAGAPWPQPVIQLIPSFEPAKFVEDRAASGGADRDLIPQALTEGLRRGLTTCNEIARYAFGQHRSRISAAMNKLAYLVLVYV